MVKVIDGKVNAKRNTQVINDRLSKMREIGEEEYTARTANKLSLPYADLHIIPLRSDDVHLLPREISESFNLILFSKNGKKVSLGTPYPENPEMLAYIKEFQEKNGWTATLYVISPASIKRGLEQYDHVFFIETLNALRLTLSGQDLESFEAGVGKLLSLKDHTDSLSTTEILTIIFSGAIALEASDIHLEPGKSDVRLRYRVDGILQDIVSMPRTIHKSLVARIKLMSKMKINIRDRAQDGRFSFQTQQGQVDMRSSTIPSKNAEGIVLRILSNKGIGTSLEELGIVGKAYAELLKTVGKTDGIILTTGPTGSGKTTTLYSIIAHINSPETKIITIENPIEYEFEGIVQTEVSKSKDYTFSKALRAIVRQDPDVILVGEIRDAETADIAMNAALTGHLVLSTLHTNGAVATIARLIELGVRPNLIPPATNIFLAQRLVRKLCVCKKPYAPAQEVRTNILQMISLISPKANLDVPTQITELYQPAGCTVCHGTGYKGRVGIFEALVMTEAIEKLVLDMAGETEITKTAIEDGFVTMTQDGILKALAGVTSMEEIWRVTSENGLIAELYENLMSQSLTKRLSVSNQNAQVATDSATSLEQIAATISTSQSSDILAQIFAYAAHLQASDIHLEPSEQGASVRVRVDGVLETIANLSTPQYAHIISEVKGLAEIPTTIRQGVSDSRFGILFEQGDLPDQKADVRVSIIVGGFGETVVMRMLSGEVTQTDIHNTGITPYNLERLLVEAKKPYGMIINTGPTGSGKTTTLYSLLSEIKNDTIKIITIEDPIEYQISGILQTQVNPEEDYTFTKALRALLRQDPDIILLGEIRDQETARTAISAAQTGHLLITTLHTNNAVSSIQRLTNLGVSTDDLSSSVNAIMAQRLVRKLCECKVEAQMTPEEKELIAKTLGSISPKVPVPEDQNFKLYNPGSCEHCSGLGFKGRTVVSEVLLLDADITALIARGALLPEITQKAIENGMLTMEQDGILKALSGETSLSEIRRTTMV